MLAYIVAAVGAVIVLLGAAVIVAPVEARRIMGWVQTPRALYAAVGVRLVAGAFLIIASDACAWPMAIGTIGVIMLAAGLAGLLIGMRRLRALMAWFVGRSDGMFRAAGVAAALFGALIVYAAV